MIEEEGKCRAEAEARGLPVQGEERKQEGGRDRRKSEHEAQVIIHSSTGVKASQHLTAASQEHGHAFQMTLHRACTHTAGTGGSVVVVALGAHSCLQITGSIQGHWKACGRLRLEK